MKYTKLFNNHEEYLAYTASTSFNVPNVSWCIQEEEAHCTPPNICQEEHEYALYGEPSYPSTIEADETMFKIEYEYSDTYTAKTCSTGITYGQDYGYVLISPNETTSARTISGVYHDDFRNIDAPYSLTQKGITITVDDPVISSDGVDITITCATQGADIYYQLDSTGEFSLYTGAITMTADTFVEAYATFSGVTSTTVSETCEYTPTHDYSKDYLTFDVLTGGTIMWKANNNVTKTISYSINNGAWTEITASTNGTAINVSAGDKVRLKGENDQYSNGNKDNASMFSGGTAYYNAEGNIMSLISGDSFSAATTFTNTWVFHDLFNNSKVVSAENLILPVTTMTTCCYRAMFAHSSALITPPELPATTLKDACYWYMFQDCPFTTAPVLNASTLVKECYGGMFDKCPNLNYIKCLATNISASNCLQTWVSGVASTGTFVKDPSINVGSSGWSAGVNGIPTGWLVQDDGTPDIPTISCNGLKIELSCGTEGADIYYKLTSAGSYSAYTSPIIMTGDTDVWCYSEKDGMSSTTTSMTCEYDDRTIYEYANQSLDTWTRSGSAVTVPNSVNAIDGHSSSYAKGTFNYETTVNLRDAEPTYLWFQHADHKADIYVDDVLVDTHWGGYNAFFSDISNYAHEGTNHIKVVLKNNNGDYLAPASGDFNFNATLGKVKLFTSPYIPAMNYGYDGFHITSTVSTGSATINVATSVPTGASVVCTISGVNCNYTATSASTGNEMIFTTTITNPRLWNGKIDPYLYNVKLEIYHDNELYHKYERPYGLRFYEYVIDDTVKYGTPGNPYTGFLLNGQPYLLRGCCMHDDIANKANALNDADYAQTFNIIQELGLNFLRLAHYPHPKEVYDWCDRLGIVVQTEGSCVNKLQSTMPTDYYTHLTGQYTDMVNQHYNHPCIFFWGLSNETSTDDKNFGKQKVEEYTALIKNLDSERMVGYVLAQGNGTSPSAYYNDPSNVDWFGCNIYVGWYDSPNSNDPTPQITTRLNNTIGRVSKPMAYSEYGCGGTSTCHSDDFMNTTTRGNHERHDIEYQMWLHEGHIAAIKNFPQLLYTSQWQLFDIAVASRNEGYTECLDGINTSTNDALRRLNNKGLVERDHVTKKDTFYLYKAWWNQTDKFVHICQKNYQKIYNRAIKCYTNDGNTLTMYINGVSAATATVTDNIATFEPRIFNTNDVIKVSGATSSDEFTIKSNEYEGFCKLSLRDGSTIEIEGSGELTSAMTSGYSATCVSAEVGTACTSIGERAFFYFSALTDVNISYHVTSIANSAFTFCSNISNVTIPDSVTSIGMNAFNGCIGLKKCTIGNGVTTIDYGVFNGCSGLTSVVIPDSVTSIGNRAFYGCSGLTSMTIPSGITKISDSMFERCYKLKTVTIENGITSIGKGAFFECSGLASINIPGSVTKIESGAFGWCDSISSCTIGNGVKTIENSVFSGCTSLESITIPSSVTSIGNDVLSYCSGLTSVTVDSNNSVYDSRNNCNAIIHTSTNKLVYGCGNTVIPNTVTSIGASAFYGQKSLTSITIPSSVTSMDEAIFGYCYNLKSITSERTTAPSIVANTFLNFINGGTLYVPQGSTGYNTWMGTGNYYLGSYGWTMVKQ